MCLSERRECPRVWPGVRLCQERPVLSPVDADGTCTSYSPLLGGRLWVSRFNTSARGRPRASPRAERGPSLHEVAARGSVWPAWSSRGLDCRGGGLSEERGGAGASSPWFLGPSSLTSSLPVHHSTQNLRKLPLCTFGTLTFLSKPTNLSSGRITSRK